MKTPLRVVVDTSPLAQTRAGTARHLRGLLGALAGRADVEIATVACPGSGRLATVRRDGLWYPWRLAGRAVGADVLHCPTFRAPLRPRTPLVVTVHDCALLRHPGAFPPWHRHTGRLALRSAVRTADAVVAVSRFTRDELVELLAVPEERIVVVPNAVDPVFTPHGPAAGGDYVLAVGTLEPRKNLAHAVLAASRAGVDLRVVGAEGWGGVRANAWVGEPDDEELAALYRGARCLVFPSLYEGFGIPVLEAMACGTPVVTSRGGATEEVAGGGAVLVDATDVEAIAAGIDEAVRRRDELVPLGLARAASFTWDGSAATLVDAWRAVA